MSFGTLVEGFAHNVGFKDAKKGRAIIIGGFSLIVVGAIAFGIYKWRKRANERRESSTDSTTSELDALTINGKNTTISAGDAVLISQNLLGAMNQMGTDYDAVIDNLSKAKNADDLKLIIKTFGVKGYAISGLADGLISRFTGTMLNLNGWLREELSGNELIEVENLFKSYGMQL